MPHESFLNPWEICNWSKVTYNKSGKRSWIDHENKWKNEIAWSPNWWTNDFPAPSIRRLKTNLSVTEILERTLCTWQVECHEKVQEKDKYMPPHFLLPEKEWYSRMCSVKNLACRIDTPFICCSPDLAVTNSQTKVSWQCLLFWPVWVLCDTSTSTKSQKQKRNEILIR